MKFRYAVVILLSVLTLSACAKTPAANSDHESGSPASSASSSTSDSQLSSITSDSQPQSPIDSEAELPDDGSVLIDDVSFSLHESKQDILAKLEQAGLNNREFAPENPEEAKYDFYYNDGDLQIYISHDECVRLRLIDGSSGELIWNGKGISPGNTVSQMLEQFGDEYETHSYSYKGIYTIYRYSFEDYICEFGCQFGIEGERADYIYNTDIYVPSQAPIYDYGEEI